MKKLILALFLLPLFATAQTVGIKIATPIIKNNPADNTVTGYAHLINGTTTSYPTKASIDSLVNQFSATLRTGMSVYVISTDSTYRLQTNNTWVAVAPGNITQSLANLLPAAQKGQVMRGLANNTAVYGAYNLIDTGIYVNTPLELATALAQPTPTQGQIFQTWRRFAHGGRTGSPGNQGLNDTIPSIPNMTQSWSYDTVTNTISSTFNSGPAIGFVSPNKYTNYTLSANLKSTDTDNDRVGVVLAYIDDQTDMVRNNAFGLNPILYPGINTSDSLIANQHTLSMYINRESGRPFYAIWYDYGKLSQKLIIDGSTLPGLSNLLTGWNNATTGVDIEVIRRVDSIYITRTQFSDAVGGKGPLGFQLAISLTQDPVLYKFRGGSSYGFACNSQALASFTINFTGGSSGAIYDIPNNDVYIPNGAGGYMLDTTTTATNSVPVGQVVYNPLTNKLFYKQDTFLELKPTNQYIETVNSFLDLQNYSGTSTTLIYTDSLRGGIFNYYPAVTGYDNGVIVQAIGKGSGAWVRGGYIMGSPVFPEWWGALPDGIANTTSAINHAVDFQSGHSGGTVFLAGSKYLIKPDTAVKHAIRLKSNITLQGAGMDATQIINDTTIKAVPDPGYVSGNNYILIRLGGERESVYKVTVKDLTLVGNQSIINGGNTAGVPGFFGIISRFRDSTVSDLPALKAAHADNITISNVKVLNTLWAIGASKAILGQVAVGDTSIKHNNNWMIDRCFLNGTFNRIMEFQFSDNLTVQNSQIFGAGHVHFLSGDRYIKFLNNYMRYGNDMYSHDWQHQNGDKQASAFYMNHSVDDITVEGNTIEADPGIDPSIGYGAAIRINAESPQAFPFEPIKNFKSRNNTYRNLYTTNREVIEVRYTDGRPLDIRGFSFDRDSIVGIVSLAPNTTNGLLTVVRDWTFDNCTIDSVELPRKSYTAGSGGFTFRNSRIRNDFNNVATSLKLIGTQVDKLTIPSYADSTVIDNSTYTSLALNAANTTTMFKNMPVIPTTASDATYSLRYTGQSVALPAITANRTVSLNASPIYAGYSAMVRNGNTSNTFSWSFAASTVVKPDGTFLTTIPNNTSVEIVSNGDGTWRAKSLTYAGFAIAGGNNVTLTASGSTNVTLPTTGTLTTQAGTEPLSNKTIPTTTNNITATASRVAAFNSSGNLISATATTAELGYLSGVTSALQTQLNTKVTNPMTTAGDGIYGGASGVPTRFAGNATATTKFLTQVSSGAPVYFDLFNSNNIFNGTSDYNSAIGINGQALVTGSSSFNFNYTRSGLLALLNAAGTFSTNIAWPNVSASQTFTFPDTGGAGGTFAITTAATGYVVNTTTVGLSSATLNSIYPSVSVGYRVICPSITLGGAIYVKATEAGSSDVWLLVSAPVAP